MIRSYGRPDTTPDPLGLGDGSLSAPSYGFSADTDTGLYRETAVALLGTGYPGVAVTASGVEVWRAGANASATNGLAEAQLLIPAGSSSRIASYSYHGLNSASADTEFVSIYTLISSPTAGSESCTLTFKVMRSGTGAAQLTLSDGATFPNGATVSSGKTLVLTGARVTPSFTSSETTVTGASATTTVAHGLGVVPRQYWVRLRCKTAELGYSIGDEVTVQMSAQTSGPGTLWADATNLGLTRSGAAWEITRRDTFAQAAFTAGNWKLVFYAIA